MTSYRVADFSDIFDWRPMLFQEPIVAHRACALCGIVYKKAVRLPCLHTMCTKCLAQCVERGSACPVDQKPFCEDDVEQLETSLDYILKRKVACWNALKGCSFIGPAASLLDHYKECEFSVVPCCLCRSSVLQRDVLEHFRNGCSIHEAKCVPTNSPATEDLKHVSTACLEMRSAMGKISEDLMSLQTSLNQCSENITVEGTKCKVQWEAETARLAEQLNNLSTACTAGFAEELQLLRTIMADYKEHVSKTLDLQLRDLRTICTTQVPKAMQVALQAATADYKKHVSKELSLLTLSKPTRVHWYIEGWTDLKKQALESGLKSLDGPKSNMYGYSVCQRVQLTRKDDEVSFSCFMKIHPGDNDLQLEWPFRKVYTLGIIHPKDQSNVISHKVNPVYCGENVQHCFLRPKGKENVGCGNRNLTTVEKLEMDGFIQSDTLHMFLEIEP
uniref:Putative tnf receptor-associated factor n=1 Tax=Ixodes ricinus TaxID=34613 RepID=V5IF75_IXORI